MYSAAKEQPTSITVWVIFFGVFANFDRLKCEFHEGFHILLCFTVNVSVTPADLSAKDKLYCHFPLDVL